MRQFWKFFLRRWIKCDYMHWTGNNPCRNGAAQI